MRVTLKKLITLFVIIVALPAAAWAAGTVDLPDGSKLDMSVACPVCNMKLETSALGPAAVVFKDGKVVGFDGPGDFFRYILDPGKYGYDAANVKSVYVTDYGTPKFMDAKTAFFVVGSDFMGEMGPEVAPFSTKEAAEKFKTDHHGKDVVKYSDVKPADVAHKKKMMKMQH